jgi:hypothetical protein
MRAAAAPLKRGSQLGVGAAAAAVFLWAGDRLAHDLMFDTARAPVRVGSLFGLAAAGALISLILMSPLRALAFGATAMAMVALAAKVDRTCEACTEFNDVYRFDFTRAALRPHLVLLGSFAIIRYGLGVFSDRSS